MLVNGEGGRTLPSLVDGWGFGGGIINSSRLDPLQRVVEVCTSLVCFDMFGFASLPKCAELYPSFAAPDQIRSGRSAKNKNVQNETSSMKPDV